jgi:dolichol-phosphate mannosyltransferase
MSTLCVLIPTYNEEDNIMELLQRIFELDIFDLNIVFIDGLSKDKTKDTILELQENDSRIHLIEVKSKGIGVALAAGMSSSLLETINPDYIITMDGDLSHDPKFLPDLMKACTPDTVVIGSRYINRNIFHDRTQFRKIISSLVNSYTKNILNINVQDATSGYRCYPPNILKQVIHETSARGYTFQIEILRQIFRKGHIILELPIVFNERKIGKSKLNWFESLRFLFEILKISLCARVK